MIRYSPRRVASAASSARLATPSLVKTCATWVFTVPWPMNIRWPIWVVVSPLVTNLMTLNSVGVRLAQPAEGRLRSPRARDT